MKGRNVHSLDYAQRPSGRGRGTAILTLLGVTLVNGLVTGTLFCLGILGLSGDLTDTSERENHWQGMGFLAMTVPALLWSAACFIALKPRKRGETGRTGTRSG